MPWVKNFDVTETLDIAMRVFWSHGYEATSMDHLLREMGINKGSLYHAFGGKRELFLAALEHYDQNYRCRLLSECEVRGPGVASIRKLFDHWIDRATKHRRRNGCFMTNTAIELAAHDDELRTVVARSQRDVERFFREMISHAQLHGEVDENIDPRTAARSLLGAFIGLLVLSRSRPERALMRAIANNAIEPLESHPSRDTRH